MSIFAFQDFIDNSEIIVEREAERVLQGWKPRRLGGGFGGNKQSGQLRFGCRDRPFRKPINLVVKEESYRRYEYTMICNRIVLVTLTSGCGFK